MDFIAWLIILFCFVIGFIGLVYPIIPSVIFILMGFVVYGLFFSFTELPRWFWYVEGLFVILIFSADFISNTLGVKKYGGSKAGVWGSTIGLIVGPFVIPFVGLLIGPFVGAIIAELLFGKSSIKQAMKIGYGSVIGFLTSVVTKGIILLVMVAIFFFGV